MKSPDAPIAKKGFFVTHFLTVKDQARSKEFYVEILGGKVVKPENPCYIKLENSWIILNSGGGPTPDKPEVILETPQNFNRVSSFLNLRVANIRDCYKKWSAKGAHFLTEPMDNHGHEWRCYMRDPDGYLIEVGEYSQTSLDNFNEFESRTKKKKQKKRLPRNSNQMPDLKFHVLEDLGARSGLSVLMPLAYSTSGLFLSQAIMVSCV